MAKKTNINELARRYTTATFDLARAEKKLDAVAADLQKILEQLNADETALKMLASPLLTSDKQVEFAREYGKKLGLNSVTQNFLLVVASNRRLKHLPQIIAEFQRKIASENNEATAIITSSAKLEVEELKKIAAALSKKTGKKINITEVINEKIIGGLVIKIGSVMYDYSVKTKLSNLAAQLKKVS